MSGINWTLEFVVTLLINYFVMHYYSLLGLLKERPSVLMIWWE